MIDPNLTDEQRQAVTDGGGSLLVSAAAGSGKTKVLVERLFRRVEEEHCSVDDFLIITYTRAAAAELRGKIARELSQRVAQQPENVHLRRQLFRVYQADIKTVDAFCGSLLRIHGPQIGPAKAAILLFLLQSRPPIPSLRQIFRKSASLCATSFQDAAEALHVFSFLPFNF